MKKIILFIPAFILAIHFGQSQNLNLYQNGMMIENNDTLRYRILYPDNYEHGKSYPVVVFLHGIGERGRDNQLQLTHGADLFVRNDVREKFPAIVIFPQCPPDMTWSYRVEQYDSSLKKTVGRYPFHQPILWTENMVKELTDKLISSGIADKKRIYIVGLSMGAAGTYDLLVRFPNYYTAAITIAGENSVTLMAKNCKSLPLWIFHGAKDDIIDPQTDRTLYAQLKGIDPNLKYTEYPDANHNSWDPAFAEPDLLPWLFAQHK